MKGLIIYILLFFLITLTTSCNLKRGSGCGCPTFGIEQPSKNTDVKTEIDILDSNEFPS